MVESVSTVRRSKMQLAAPPALFFVVAAAGAVLLPTSSATSCDTGPVQGTGYYASCTVDLPNSIVGHSFHGGSITVKATADVCSGDPPPPPPAAAGASTDTPVQGKLEISGDPLGVHVHIDQTIVDGEIDVPVADNPPLGIEVGVGLSRQDDEVSVSITGKICADLIITKKCVDIPFGSVATIGIDNGICDSPGSDWWPILETKFRTCYNPSAAKAIFLAEGWQSGLEFCWPPYLIAVLVVLVLPLCVCCVCRARRNKATETARRQQLQIQAQP